jgi:hypothetical protein
MKTETENVRWCRDLFCLLKEGGEWGVPRSGLVFIKKGETLVLKSVMPYSDDLRTGYEEGLDVPANAKDLLEYQKADFECIRGYFEEAGIEVKSEVF